MTHVIFRGQLAKDVIGRKNTQEKERFYQELGEIEGISYKATNISSKGLKKGEHGYREDAVMLDITARQLKEADLRIDIREAMERVEEIIRSHGGEICTQEVHLARRKAAADRKRMGGIT